MKAIKVIAADVDGTLLDSKQCLTDGSKKALTQAADAGIQVVVATGKARGGWTQDVLPHLPRIPGVFMQGLLIYDADGNILHEQHLSADVIKLFIDFCKKRDLTLTAYCGDRILANELNEQTERLVWYKEPTPERVDLEAALLGPDAVHAHKLLIMTPAFDSIADIRTAANGMIGDKASLTQALPGMLEVLPPGASKGAGVQRVLQQLDAKQEELLAIGDGENDIEMLELASVAVAMGNAGEKLRGLADWVAPSNDDDGVAATIHKVLNGAFDSLAATS